VRESLNLIRVSLGDGPLGSTLVSLYLDGDNVADMTIQVVHQPA
jgi:hypothetical protein